MEGVYKRDLAAGRGRVRWGPGPFPQVFFLPRLLVRVTGPKFRRRPRQCRRGTGKFLPGGVRRNLPPEFYNPPDPPSERGGPE